MTPYWLFIASSTGLRKTLRTDRKKTPVYSFWSRTLKYEYLYGRRFIVIDDHKLLKSIFKRSIIFFPFFSFLFRIRIQKFFLRLQKYDFEPQYSPGKDTLVSDTLSRSHLSDSEPKFTENSLIHHVHFVQSNIPISETRLKQFQLETKNGPILKTLITYTTHEWPEKHLIATDLYPPQ